MSTKEMNSALEIARKEFKQKTSAYESTISSLKREAIMPASVRGSSMEAQLAFNLKVVENFATATKKYCANCDAIVLSLDVTCRPMLSGKVSAQAVGDVARFMEQVKQDVDEIDIDFSVSFDGIGVGSVGAFRPMLSLAAQTVVMFWNNHYQSMPGYKKDQERLQAEAEAERELMQERRRYFANVVASSRESVAKKKADAVAVAKTRDEVRRRCDRNIEAYRSALMTAQRTCRSRLLAAETHRLQEEMAAAQERLSQLKFFDFDGKKAAKAIIKNCKKSLVNVTLPASTLAKLDEVVRAAREQYERTINVYFKARFVFVESVWDVDFFGETANDAEILAKVYGALSYTPQSAEEIANKCGSSGAYISVYLWKITKSRRYLLCTPGKVRRSETEYAFNPDVVKQIELWKDKKPNSEIPPIPQDAEELFSAF